MSPGVAKGAGEASPLADKDHADAILPLVTETSGAGMFSKLIIFGIVVGAVAIVLKRRKANSDAMDEKTLA